MSNDTPRNSARTSTSATVSSLCPPVFRAGDRVAFTFNPTSTGTVTSAAASVVRVGWDDGQETPVDPTELQQVV